MDCAVCCEDTHLHRIILDAIEATFIGGFCSECEQEFFGNSLTHMSWNSTDGCLLCNRDGLYLLPELTIVKTNDRECLAEAFDVDITISDMTPELCDEHLHRIVGADGLSEVEPTSSAVAFD